MDGIDKFYPPKGRFYLAVQNGVFVGVGCLKALEGGIGEIKRMFLREDYRGMGIAKGILERLIVEASDRLSQNSVGQSQICHQFPRLVPIQGIPTHPALSWQ
jgi:GNAT superfamily N-acetyltransferase